MEEKKDIKGQCINGETECQDWVFHLSVWFNRYWFDQVGVSK